MFVKKLGTYIYYGHIYLYGAAVKKKNFECR